MATPPGREWDAAAYHLVSEPQFAWGLAVLDRLAPRGDETALDAGCGSGRLTVELARRLPRGRVVALDLARGMAARARQTLREAGLDALVVQADLGALPLRGAADLVFSTATFHWVRDHDRLFREVYRALRPGGRLVAQCGGGRNLARVHAVAARLMAEPELAPRFAGWEAPWQFAHEEETWRRLEEAGFVDVRVSLLPAPTAFPTREALRAFLAAVVLRPHLAHLARLADDGAAVGDVDGAARRDGFLDAAVDALAREAPGLTLDYWRLNVEARRP